MKTYLYVQGDTDYQCLFSGLPTDETQITVFESYTDFADKIDDANSIFIILVDQIKSRLVSLLNKSRSSSASFIIVCTPQNKESLQRIFLLPSHGHIYLSEPNALSLKDNYELACKRTETHSAVNSFDTLKSPQKNISDKNNAIGYVTSLVRSCSMVQSYEDIVKTVELVRGKTGASGFVFFYNDVEKRKQKVYSHGHFRDFDSSDMDLSGYQNECRSLSKDMVPKAIADLFDRSWNHCMEVSVSSESTPNSMRGLTIFFFKEELLPFSGEDGLFFELAHPALKFAIDKIHSLRKANIASEEWSATFDAIHDPVTVVSDQFNILKANSAFATLVGAEAEKLKNRTCHILLAKSLLPCHGCASLRNTNRPYGSKIRAKKKRTLAQWSYQMSLDTETYFIQFYRDISKEQQLSADLAQSEKMRSLGRLLKAVSHQIYNPVAAVLSTAQVILQYPEEYGFEESHLEEIREIEKAARRATEIINELSCFMMNRGSDIEAVDIKRAIDGTLIFAKSILTDVAVSTAYEDDLPVTFSNYGAIQQILFNLITNAVHALQDSRNIYIRAYRKNDKLVVAVADSGSGISRRNLKKIFEPFYTSKKEGKGTGLGLTIVKMLAEKYNAEIEADSEPGKGTTFYINLPLEQEVHENISCG